MDRQLFLQGILPYLGGQNNISRQAWKDNKLCVTVKDVGTLQLEDLEKIDAIASVELDRGRINLQLKTDDEKEKSKMAKNFDPLANSIIQLVGGKENVTLFMHCITRLRFTVKDREKVKNDELKNIPGVLGTQWAGNQLQVIIGQDVNEVYDLICAKTGLAKQAAVDENPDQPKKKFSINTIFEVLSACIVPVIPAMCGSGIIKGILIALTTYEVIDSTTGLYIILNAISDATFYYLPFLVAYGASKKFNTNTILSMVIAGLYLHPTIVALAKTEISVVGIPMTILNYSSTVFPIVISIWLMSYIYRFFEKHIPSAVRIVFAPTLTFFVMALLSLGLVGPIGYYIGFFIAQAINWLFGVAPVVAGFVLGAIRPLVILTGMQTVFTPLIANNIAVMGYDVISPVHTAATMAAAGLCLGAFLRARNAEDRNSNMSFFISAFIGITEPALYGLAFRFKSMLIALMVGGGIGGAISAILGVKKYASGMPSWITFPAFGDTMPQMFISVGITLVVTAALAYFLSTDKKESEGKK